jgi:hypothetical protein
MVKILLSEQSLPPKSARDGKAIILRVNANYHHNSKHYRCFGNVQPQCSLHEFGNDVRSCHNFSPIDLVCFGLAAQCCFGTMDVRSNPAKQHKNDNDDQDGADDTDTTVSITVTVAAEPATEAAEQKNNEDDNENESNRHTCLPFLSSFAFAVRSSGSYATWAGGMIGSV